MDLKRDADEVISMIRGKREVELTGMDLSGADLTKVDLSDGTLFDANLSKADLIGSDLSGCDLTGADLSNADLTKARLSNARLWNANLSGAKLVEADLSNADLWNANLHNARLWRTNLAGAKGLTRNSFRCPDGRLFKSCSVHEEGYISAEETYRNLKRYFIAEGRYNDASWASFKEKTMEKMLLKRKKSIAYLPAAFMGAICGYGEKPQRIVTSSLVVIFIYGVIFRLLDMAVSARDTSLHLWDYVYYSVVTFTTLGYGDIVPKASTAYRLLAASEAFLGVFLMGLFIFTLARKYSAR